MLEEVRPHAVADKSLVMPKCNDVDKIGTFEDECIHVRYHKLYPEAPAESTLEFSSCTELFSKQVKRAETQRKSQWTKWKMAMKEVKCCKRYCARREKVCDELVTTVQW